MEDQHRQQEVREQINDRLSDLMEMQMAQNATQFEMHRENREQHRSLGEMVTRYHDEIRTEIVGLATLIASHAAMDSHPGTAKRLDQLEQDVRDLREGRAAMLARWGVIGAAVGLVLSQIERIAEFFGFRGGPP